MVWMVSIKTVLNGSFKLLILYTFFSPRKILTHFSWLPVFSNTVGLWRLAMTKMCSKTHSSRLWQGSTVKYTRMLLLNAWRYVWIRLETLMSWLLDCLGTDLDVVRDLLRQSFCKKNNLHDYGMLGQNLA